MGPPGPTNGETVACLLAAELGHSSEPSDVVDVADVYPTVSVVDDSHVHVECESERGLPDEK